MTELRLNNVEPEVLEAIRELARRREAKRALVALGHTLRVIVHQVLWKREG